ncbi:hypothetical protein CMI45_01375 [Candidatus Pacearchaeota archaeon]|nr:hypothetical protein [Candidatus Pacearchaeota archaeon]|tara:strand:+ start:860 stop:1894 length:1035 start_codon:yes stop_codon:yes gene_type:complete
MEHNEESSERKNWYDKSYKLLLIIPAILLLFSLVYLYGFVQNTGDIIRKDVSLTGGTSVSVFDGNVEIDDLKSKLLEEFPDLRAREISDFRTGKQQGFFVETRAGVDEITGALENYLGYELNQQNSSIEFTGETLSKGFYQQVRNAIFTAFLFMGLVVFLIFGKSKKMKSISVILTIIAAVLLFKSALPVLIGLIVLALILIYIIYSIPSAAVILSAFADIVMTIALVNLLGMELSIAGVIAFLMLIGYSVDTDILLTSRLVKRHEGSINKRMFDAFKTGITMTLTSMAAVAVSLFIIYNFSETLKQIFTILIIGLGFDILNTWLGNASILKLYVEKKGLGGLK